jgi:hypothetical protein
MRKFLNTTLALLCLSAGSLSAADAMPKQAPPKWIFFFRLPSAQIKQVNPGKFQLVIYDPVKTQLFMLNDRPFYLIRKLSKPGKNLWSDFARSSYDPNKQITATLIFGQKAKEVILSDLELSKGTVTYNIKSANTTPLTATKKNSLEMFTSAESKPLCNFMNEIRHDSTALHKLSEINS